jgi:hypothetical protein
VLSPATSLGGNVIGLLWAVGLVGIAILWAEVVHVRASRSHTYPDRGGPEVVVVLGYRNRGSERANTLNRWRVRAGLRSIDSCSPSSQLVLCGGSPYRDGPSEAALMARYAIDECGFTGDVVLDEASRSTWENVENAVPLIEEAQRVKFVSNPLHSQKARLYLQVQRPDLAPRMVRSADNRVGEWSPLKPLFAAYGLLDMARTKKSLASRA